MPPKVRRGMSVWGAGRRVYEQTGRHVDMGPPAESLYGKKRKGTSSTRNVTAKEKEAHDVKSSDDSDSTEDEQDTNGVSRSSEKKAEGVAAKAMAPKQRAFELEEIVYVVDQRNKCTKLAIGRITGRPGMEYMPNVLVAEGWYQVCVTEVYHPQTPLQWPDESRSIFKLSQVVNMDTLWGEDYIMPIQ